MELNWKEKFLLLRHVFKIVLFFYFANNVDIPAIDPGVSHFQKIPLNTEQTLGLKRFSHIWPTGLLTEALR